MGVFALQTLLASFTGTVQNRRETSDSPKQQTSNQIKSTREINCTFLPNSFLIDENEEKLTDHEIGHTPKCQDRNCRTLRSNNHADISREHELSSHLLLVVVVVPVLKPQRTEDF